MELMVVVAIAGILMSLLLPALSSAKEKSRRSVCNQNERQVIIALQMYAIGYDQFLPDAANDQGGYNSMILSDLTFTNIMLNLGDSNCLYCPNLVYANGSMDGEVPGVGHKIGYSYLAAAQQQQQSPKGPDTGWQGPMKATDNKQVLADANYWIKTSALAMTLAPHSRSGGVALVSSVSVAGLPISSSPSPGVSSAAAGAVGGNIGSLDGSVVWKPIRVMNIYPASTDGAMGNW